MAEFLVGEVLRVNRNILGKSLDWACEGICDSATLFRLENGEGSLSYEKIKKLLKRLGVADDWVCVLLNNEEEKRNVLKSEIISLNMQFERANAENKPRIRAIAIDKLDELENMPGRMDMLTEQFIYRSRKILGKEDGPYSLDESVDLLTRAIRATCKNFSLHKISDGLYGEEEIKLINQIAIAYTNAGEHEIAINILEQLFRYVQDPRKCISVTQSCIPLVAYNYSLELIRAKWYEEALRVIGIGKDMCINYRSSIFLPDLIASEARCHYEIGDKDESLHLYCQAYYIYQAQNNGIDSEIVMRNIKKIKQNKAYRAKHFRIRG